MTDYKLQLEKVTMIFGRRLIFKEINYEFSNGKVYGIAGHNGSGKSTLSKIISGIIAPTKGKVNHTENGKKIIPEKLHDYLGFVSPYLVLYDEFTAEENLFHFSKIRGQKFDKENAKNLLNHFGIYDRRNDLLKGYSSGMKQRMKFVFALMHNPRLLLLDEPTSNLDAEGKEKVYQIIEEQAKNNLVIVASNEETDLGYCNETLEVEMFKNSNGTK